MDIYMFVNELLDRKGSSEMFVRGRYRLSVGMVKWEGSVSVLD